MFNCSFIKGDVNLKPRAKSAAPIDLELVSKLKPTAIVFLIVFLIFSALILLAEGRSEEDSVTLREEQVAQQFDALRQNPEELRAFFLAMPKGGDIHNHLTGAVYAEDLIDQASAQDLCINLDNYTVSPNYCGSSNSEPVEECLLRILNCMAK